MSKICEWCGAEFVDQSPAKHGRFCSTKCTKRAYREVNRERIREYKHAQYEANKEKVLARNRAWYDKNKESQKEWARVYREANRDAINERNRVYYQTTREANNAHSRAWYANHREAHLENNRRWHKAHPEARKEHRRKWSKANPEKVRENGARRRARKMNAYVAPVDREAIYKRDNYTCQLCGELVEMDEQHPHPMSPVIDHILPLARGGTHEPRNVQLTHSLCNQKKGATIINQLRVFSE